MKNKKVIIIRADGSSFMGSGHIMRMLAIAQFWKDYYGKVIFVCASITDGLKTILDHEDIELYNISDERASIEDANKTSGIACDNGAGWIVVDGYQFDSLYQKQLRDNGLKVLFVDDFGHCDYYYANIILNRGIHAREEFYQDRNKDTILLLGTKYTLFRREFLTWMDWKREISDTVNQVLVIMGGGDHENMTSKVIESLNALDNNQIMVKVIVGFANVHKDVLLKQAKDSPLNIELLQNVRDMPTLMAKSDLAITAGGTTLTEMAYMGLPNISLKVVNNQRALPILSEIGVTEYVGEARNIPPIFLAEKISDLINNTQRRRQLSYTGQHLFNGHGVAYLCERLSDYRGD